MNRQDLDKAIGLLKSYHDEFNSELSILENRLDKSKNDIYKKQNEIDEFNSKISINDDVFVPVSLRNNDNEKYDYLLHELELLKSSNKIILENIDYANTKISEYEFIISVFESLDTFKLDKNDLLNKLDFISKLIDTDRVRAKEEMFHVKQFVSEKL